jgi:hypothetical protein
MFFRQSADYTGMERQRQSLSTTAYVVDRVAKNITDPVTRLRFLQATAPLPSAPRKANHRKRLYVKLLAAMLVAALAGLVLLVRGTAGPVASSANYVLKMTPPRQPSGAPGLAASAPPGAQDEIWQVEAAEGHEVYSNGLRIDNRFAVENHPRGYLAFPAAQMWESSGIRRSLPVGIVYHTTESRQAPFEPGSNRTLKRIGESLLDYVRRERAYHYLIDRFGRVYRVVREQDAANHAGYSVWADDQWLYVNLNESFLAVAFEAYTEPGQVESKVNPAQIRVAASLTELLRRRYGIPAGNCVTHAQVSVNPVNMRVGFHTDWASSFPFQELGLPDNYAKPIPALRFFGFEADPVFLHKSGERMRPGVELAENDLQTRAAAYGISAALYRKKLETSYRRKLAAIREFGAAAEGN